MKSIITTVVILFFFTACDSSFLSSENNSFPLRLKLDITSENIQTIQDIEADFTVTNISFEEVTVKFTSSCQNGFKIERNDEVLLNSRTVIGCQHIMTELELASLKSKTYQISLSDMAGSDSLESGEYHIKAFLLSDKSPHVESTFFVK